VMVLRAGAENRAGLRALLEREIAALQPYARGADGAAK